jgi:hypothetical protein
MIVITLHIALAIVLHFLTLKQGMYTSQAMMHACAGLLQNMVAYLN